MEADLNAELEKVLIDSLGLRPDTDFILPTSRSSNSINSVTRSYATITATILIERETTKGRCPNFTFSTFTQFTPYIVPDSCGNCKGISFHRYQYSLEASTSDHWMKLWEIVFFVAASCCFHARIIFPMYVEGEHFVCSTGRLLWRPGQVLLVLIIWYLYIIMYIGTYWYDIYSGLTI